VEEHVIKINSTFNLLSPTRQPLTFAEKVYNWAISFGKYLIIGTELVVLVAFGARFSLDYDISELTDRIETTSQSVAMLDPYETKYQELFSKTSSYLSLLSLKNDPADDLAHITSLADKSIVFENVNYSPDEIIIAGTTSSLNALSEYELALQKETTVYHTQHPDELVPIRYASVSVTHTQAGSNVINTNFVINVVPLGYG